ncbi:MAG: hypothetical protein LBL99_01560 [Holosporaceae bacterium]|jgi:Flp pilus assembly protein CpaB|nr:hypothetical protein [Holosporaceae bacterium]
MKGKKDFIPMAIAAAIALAVTIFVRSLLPTGGGDQKVKKQEVKKEIAMPDIPLMVKESTRKKEDFILIVSKDIKREARITLDYVTWKKWPRDAMQPYFIAKDAQGTALNNGADYDNALKMWAASDIPAGVPMTLRMLTNIDPMKRKEEEKKKRAEAERKKREEEAKLRKKEEEDFLKKGMRALTFPVDPKSANFAGALRPGTLVDVLVMQQTGNSMKAYKYKALKILAVDGLTGLEKKDAKVVNNTSLLGGLGAAVAAASDRILLPKNVTLEMKEERIEEMLKRVGNNGVIVLPRSEKEKDDEGTVEEIEGVEEDRVRESLFQNIVNMNRIKAAEALQAAKKKEEEEKEAARKKKEEEEAAAAKKKEEEEAAAKKKAEEEEAAQRKEEEEEKKKAEEEKARKEAEEKNLTMLLNNMNSIGKRRDAALMKAEFDKKGKTGEGEKNANEISKYEIVSGRIIGKEEDQPKTQQKLVVIHRKLTSAAVQFDENGKKIEGETNKTPTTDGK